MSGTIDARIKIKHDTTANWDRASGFIPLAGEIIVYDDYETKTYTVEEYGEEVEKTVNIPNIKIGTGNAFVQDLAFVDSKTKETLMEHINNLDVHTTLQEKLFWNNKVNIDDSYELAHDELVGEELIFNRN
jgi:hypothetical protein